MRVAIVTHSFRNILAGKKDLWRIVSDIFQDFWEVGDLSILNK